MTLAEQNTPVYCAVIMHTQSRVVPKLGCYVEIFQVNCKFPDRKHFQVVTSGCCILTWIAGGPSTRKELSVALYRVNVYFSDLQVGCVLWDTCDVAPRSWKPQFLLKQKFQLRKQCRALRRNGRDVLTCGAYSVSASFSFYM